MTQTTAPFPALQDQQFMNLTTYRKNGDAVVTPVWFAQEGETLYVMTGAEAGKVKRIRNSGRVQVGPSDRAGKPLGPTIWAKARVLAGDEVQQADKLLGKKYGLQKKMFDAAAALRGGMASRAYLAIVPTPEEPTL